MRRTHVVHQNVKDVAAFKCDFAVIGQRLALAQGSHAGLDQITDLITEIPHGARQCRGFGHHVISGARADLGDRKHACIQRGHVAAEDALQIAHQRGGNNHRILGLLRHGCVAAAPLDGNVKELCARHGRPLDHADPARLCHGVIVHAINLVTREAFKESLGQHASGTAQPLFGGLKDHHGGAVEIAGCGQVARRPEQHGCMPVMPTGMHGATGSR